MAIDLARMVAMSVSANISSEAMTAVRARAEGLPTCHPAAPGIGINAEIRTR